MTFVRVFHFMNRNDPRAQPLPGVHLLLVEEEVFLSVVEILDTADKEQKSSPQNDLNNKIMGLGKLVVAYDRGCELKFYVSWKFMWWILIVIGLGDDALLNEISGPYKKRSLAQRAGSVGESVCWRGWRPHRITGIHEVKGENQFLPNVLWPPHAHYTIK